jgi:hypothetical protein
MKERVLRDFFKGEISADELEKDLLGAQKILSAIHSSWHIEDMDEEFEVSREMLIAVCDAVLKGVIKPENLRAIGFALQASDHFTWDGGTEPVLANVIADWSCPEINYPLTVENTTRFRRWLSGEEEYPSKS